MILHHFTLIEDKRQCILLQYLERCSRFEKTADIRLKEIRMQASVHEDSAADLAFISKNRYKKGNDKEKDKNKTQIKEKSEHPKKKSRIKKSEKNDKFFEELTEPEAVFFQTVKKVEKNLSI